MFGFGRKVKVEIDYDKLAEAIVKATKEATEDKGVITGTLSLFIRSAFYLLAVVCGVILLAIIIALATDHSVFFGSYAIQNAINGIVLFVLVFVVITFAMLFYVMARELRKETDKHYIVSLFASLVGLVAVVLMAISLYMGWSNG